MGTTGSRSSRRDVLKTIGGVLGGVHLLGRGTARGQAIGAIPNSYKFYRVLGTNEGGSLGGTPNRLGDISGSVMMATPPSPGGIGHVYLHGTERQQFGSNAALFDVVIDFSRTPPVVVRVVSIAVEGSRLLSDGGHIIISHIGTGASNASGQYVTTIEAVDQSGTVKVPNSPGVYLFQPTSFIGGSWSRVIQFGDPVPDGSSLYGGDFGDVALDDNENLLLTAATTQSPGGNVAGFAGSQALISTSLGAPTRGRVLLQTGDMLPFGSAVVESVGLIDLAPRNAFAAQITARRADPSATRSATALLVGNTQAELAQQGIVAASPELMPPDLASQRNITSGETFFGPRVDPLQDVAFVTHDGTFQPSIGSNAIETLGYYSRGSARLIQNTEIGASSDKVAAVGAPCIGSTGLMYGTQMLGDGTSQLFISDGVNSRIVLQSGVDRIPGRSPNGDLTVTEILFGQHSTQVDAMGRLAFTAEFLVDPGRPRDSANVRTALVIGIPQ